ncbi:hypothetical protein FRB94_000933 [Tulasnella sp. JGI-2019a]|nr:hypothetical protein FRB94_000933 [Tulasnella sp. JGI-2019a]
MLVTKLWSHGVDTSLNRNRLEDGSDMLLLAGMTGGMGRAKNASHVSQVWFEVDSTPVPSTGIPQFTPQILSFLQKVHIERVVQLIGDACPANASYILPFSHQENHHLKKYLKDQKEIPSATEVL